MTANFRLLLLTVCMAFVASRASAADIIIIKQGGRTVIYTGEVVRCDIDGVTFKIPNTGEIKFYKADIDDVQVDEPAAFKKAHDKMRAQQYEAAVTDLKFIVDRYGGLPGGPSWIEESVGDLVDAYLALNQLENAQQAYALYTKHYSATVCSKVKDFKIKAARKLCAEIITPLAELLDPYLKKESLSDENEPCIAEALIVQGDCLRASNKLEDALDSYLLAVTVFNVDEDRAAQAKFSAAQVFEQLLKWDRARDCYEELQAEVKGSVIAANAKTRLDELNKAHPK